jgi:hypothetical protein
MKRLAQSSAGENPGARLRQYFQHNGYVRVADPSRRKECGQLYKKGFEVRLVVATQRELVKLRQVIHKVGFKAGRPFQKHRRLVQPIYGKAAVEWFLRKKTFKRSRTSPR